MAASRKQDNHNLINHITEKITHTPSLDYASTRWQQWLDRFTIYGKMQNTEEFNLFQKFQDWPHSYQIKPRLTALMLAIHAYDELAKIDDTDRVIEDVKKLALINIDIKLTELELAQNRKLSKLQILPRPVAPEKTAELTKMRKYFNQQIEDFEPYSELLEKEIPPENLPATHAFLKLHEGRQHFSRYMKTTDKASDFMKMVHLAGTMLEKIASTGATLAVSAAQSLGHVLQAIPIIGAISSAIPIVIDAGKKWYKKRSATTRGIALLALGLAVAAIVTASVATVAASAVGVGLIAVGIVYRDILPLRKAQHKLAAQEAMLAAIDKNTWDKGDEQLTSLQLLEKHILLKKLENLWIHKKPKTEEDHQQLNDARHLIGEGKNLAAIKANPLVASFWGNKEPSLTQLFKEDSANEKKYLTEAIAAQRQDVSAKRWTLANNLLGLVGAILICIPTPVTAILGVSMLATSAVIGIATKYEWKNKIIGFFRGEKTPEPKTANPIVDDTDKVHEQAKLKSAPVFVNDHHMGSTAAAKLAFISHPTHSKPQLATQQHVTNDTSFVSTVLNPAQVQNEEAEGEGEIRKPQVEENEKKDREGEGNGNFHPHF